MIESITQQYSFAEQFKQVMPVAVDVITPGDYHLYLYHANEQDWFVVVEADYLFMKDIPKDVALSFDVKAECYFVLKAEKEKTSRTCVPADFFDSNDQNRWNDHERMAYQSIVCEINRYKYVLLKVSPNQHFDIKDFKLSYFNSL